MLLGGSGLLWIAKKSGKIMSSSTSTSNFQKVDVSDWDLGVYFVKVELVEGRVDTFKIVIE